MSGNDKLLFGAALSVHLPYDAQDVSEFREIPDSQEVFTHPYTDQSIIIELMEYMPATEDKDALRTHFETLARSNEASEDFQIIREEDVRSEKLKMTECSVALVMAGHQNITKLNETVKTTVNIHLGLLRIPSLSTDILVSFNDPALISYSTTPSVTSHWTEEDFMTIMTSLKILDASIFDD